jgi:hypothetical protein
MHGYDLAAWAAFFAALTGAAAALAGLLFVVISSGLALVPQDARLLGAEILIIAVPLTAHWGGGLYWLAPAALLGIAGAVYSARVLLVEIMR